MFIRFFWLIFLIASSLFTNSEAQILFVGNQQMISVGNSAIFTVNGDVQNNGLVINNGDFILNGNWQNLNTYNSGTGTFIAKGTSPITIAHNNQSFYKLIINSTSNVFIDSDVDIENEIQFINGILLPNNNSKLLIFSDAKVTGGTANSFYSGKLFQVGTGYKFFPLGKNGIYRPIELLEISGINPEIGVEVFEGDFDFVPGEQIKSLVNNRVYQIEATSGTYLGTPLRVSFGSEDRFEDLLGIVVAESNALSNPYNSLGQSQTTGSSSDGTVTSFKISNKEFVTLGITNEFSLPGEILVPSAFAPKGSNPADHRLKIYAKNLKNSDFVFRIFNKWGALVYETTSVIEALEEGWDGINKQSGVEMTFGVYRYVLQARFEDGKKVDKTGSITLFR
jgi:hypothetical protein